MFLFFIFVFFMNLVFCIFFFFFFNDTATTEIYTLSLHDALPIFLIISIVADAQKGYALGAAEVMQKPISRQELYEALRSEEHTSELQSPCNLVCRLLLEKKKKTTSTSP